MKWFINKTMKILLKQLSNIEWIKQFTNIKNIAKATNLQNRILLLNNLGKQIANLTKGGKSTITIDLDYAKKLFRAENILIKNAAKEIFEQEGKPNTKNDLPKNDICQQFNHLSKRRIAQTFLDFGAKNLQELYTWSTQYEHLWNAFLSYLGINNNLTDDYESYLCLNNILETKRKK